MKPEDLPEDIDGDQDANPYQAQSTLYPYNPSAKLTHLFSLYWCEQEYWRHWKRVKRDTGRWPFWSAVFHLIVMLGGIVNVILFFGAKESQDWSAMRSWVLGITFTVLWIVFFGIGREVVRSYEAKLYTEHEEDRRHFVAPR